MKLNKNIILTILTLAGFIQLTIITYNYLTGYIIITGIGNFFTRLFIGTSFSFVFALLLVFLDIQIINKLDKIFKLPEKLLPRIPSELILTVITGVLIGTTVTVIADAIMPYQDGLIKNIIANSIITSVINMIMISVIEAISWFKRSQETLLVAEKLERENSQIKI